MHYASVDEAVKLVVNVGKVAFMTKADMESAFRLLPVIQGIFLSAWHKGNDFFT